VRTIPRRLTFLFTDSRSMQMPDTSEEKIQAAATDEQFEPAVLSRKSSRKSSLALSVFAFGLNATAAVYTMSPSDFALPNVSGLMAELFPNQRAQAPIPEAVVAALKDIQSAQQQQAGALQENASLLQLNTVLLQQNTALRQQQDEATFESLRKSITSEQVEVKKISSQLSTLIAKVDSLQNTIATEITSSIPKGRARLSRAARKRMARQSKPFGPVSVGGAPLTTAPGLILSPEG
jgi:uncharacterized coiled-coil protein SlyX